MEVGSLGTLKVRGCGENGMDNDARLRWCSVSRGCECVSEACSTTRKWRRNGTAHNGHTMGNKRSEWAPQERSNERRVKEQDQQVRLRTTQLFGMDRETRSNRRRPSLYVSAVDFGERTGGSPLSRGCTTARACHCVCASPHDDPGGPQGVVPGSVVVDDEGGRGRERDAWRRDERYETCRPS